MATVSVSIPDELRKRMDALEYVNWSGVARKAFEQHTQDMEFLQEIQKKSKLTEKDAKIIADKINAGVSKQFMEAYETRYGRKYRDGLFTQKRRD